MKKLLSILAAVTIATGYMRAQTTPANIANTLYASNFAQWTVAQGNNGPLSWSSSSVCTAATSGGITFKPFVVGSPIRVNDTASPSNSEVVTVTAVNINGSGCSITTTAFTNPHFSFNLSSSTAGLQEALNYSKQSFGAANPATTVLITPAWAMLGGVTTTITVTAQGSAAASILDERTSVLVPYVWNAGTGHYVAQPFAGGACSDCVLTDPVAGQTINQTSGTLGVNSLNNVISIVPGTAITTLAQAITACGSANTTIQITQTIAVGSGTVVPRNCTLLPQSGGMLTGTSITINSDSSNWPTLQFFGAGLAVTGLTGPVRAEWFGAIPYTTSALAAAGANDVTKGQAALNSLTRGGYLELQCAYYHMGGLVISQNSQGIIGDCTGGYDTIGAGINSPLAGIVSSSATETIIAVQGTSTSNFVEFATLKNLTAQRSVTPTGTARGISFDYAIRSVVNNISSSDSMRNFYFHFAGGSAVFDRMTALWGFGAVAGSSYTTGTPTGYYLDSADGNAENSLTIANADVACGNITAVPTTGYLATGTNVSDIYTTNFASNSCSHGIDVENTGTSNFVSQDILFTNSVLNACGIDCLKINGAGSTTDIAPHVYVQGGDFFATGTGAVGANILSSSNVAISGVQFLGGDTTQTDIVLSAVNGFIASNNDFSGQSLINISCLNSTHGTINANKIKTANVTAGATGIKNVGCTLVSEQGNTIAGNTPGNLLNGITFDAASSNNGPWSLNAIDSATVTTPVTDAGTNNNTLKPSILTLAGGSAMNANQGTGAKVQHSTGTTTTGDCAQFDVNGNITDAGAACGTGGGTGISGATAGQALIAGSATTATSSKPIAGAGAALTTGPASNTLNELAYFPSTDGRVADSTILVTDVMQLSGNQTATGTKTLPSPVFTGTPTAPTAAPGTNTTQLATTAYATAAVAALSTVYAPLNNPTNGQNNYAPIAGPTFTGKTTTAASTGGSAGFNLPPGTAPTSPVNGDTWTTNVGLYARIFGATNQFLMSAASLSPSKIPVSNGGDAMVDSLLNENGVTLTYAGANGVDVTLTSPAINLCPDTSGSGTAQTCSTLATMTPGAGTCITYTTTTQNAGTGMTINVNGIGAKSIAIPGSGGWTTTLTALIIPANKPAWACYDGTNWNVQQTGTVSAGSGITFPQTVAGTTTSGGIPYFSSTTVLTSSALLPTGDFVLGGGAGGAPTATFSVVPVANGGTGAATFAAHSFLGNPTGSTAAPAASLIGTNDWSPNAYVVGAGSVNVMTATLAPVATAYVAGLQVDVLPNLANTTTTPTLNVNGLGAKTITKCGTTALAAGDYTTTAVAEFVYDGTRMQLVNPQAAGCGAGGAPALSAITAATGANTIASGDNAQVWNWKITTASKSAFTVGETTASTGTGAILMNINTLAASTAAPLSVTSVASASPALYVNASNNVGIHNTGGTGVALSVGATSGTGTTEGMMFNGDAVADLYRPFSGSIATDGGFTSGGGITSDTYNARTFSSGMTLIPNNFGQSSTTAVNIAAGTSGGAVAAGAYVQLGVTGTMSFVGTSTGSWTGIQNTGVYGSATSNVYSGSAPIKPLDISPTFNVAPTSAAGYRAININPTETSVSTQTNWLLWAGVGGTFKGGIDSKGTSSAIHFAGLSGAPTIAAGTGAGTGPTVSSTLTSDSSGYVQVLTGTLPTASASVFTVTFNVAYTAAPKCRMWPDNATTQALTGIAGVQMFDPSVTVATATSGATALIAATTYKWGYSCEQ